MLETIMKKTSRRFKTESKQISRDSVDSVCKFIRFQTEID